MNKFIKSLMLAGILLPCSIMVSACAGTSSQTNPSDNGGPQAPAGQIKQDPILTMLTTSKVYDGSELLTSQVHYAINEGAGEVSVKWYNADGTEEVEAIDVGNYMIEVTVAGNETYNSKTFEKKAFEVTAKQIAPSVVFTKQYDRTLAYDNIALTTEHGIIAGDQVIVSASAQHKNVGAGIDKESINYSGSSVGNYIIDDTSISAEITKLTIAPTIAHEITYGSFTSEGYVGSYETLTTEDGICAGDVVKVAGCYNENKDVGNYEATTTKVTGADASNYEVQPTNISITVNRKKVRITWSSNKEASYNLDDKKVYNYPTATVVASDLVSGDSCEVRYSNVPNSTTRGFATINYSYLTNGNYDLADGQTKSADYVILDRTTAKLKHDISYLKANETGWFKVNITTAGTYEIKKNDGTTNKWWVGEIKVYNASTYKQVSISDITSVSLSSGTYYVSCKPGENLLSGVHYLNFVKK